jgi:hypothetical protein
MEPADVAVMSVAVQRKWSPKHFNDGPPSSIPPGERSALSGSSVGIAATDMP